MPLSLTPTPLRAQRVPPRVVPVRPAPAHSLSLQRLRLLLRYLSALVRARLRGPIGGGEHGRLLRDLLESFGGTSTKLGQLLGMRRDVFSSEFCQEMSKVQDQALAFPGDVALRIIDEDLGARFANALSDFDEAPFAAASIGQVHRARLRTTGQPVAVKVRRPFVVEQMTLDLYWLGCLARLLTWLRIKPSFAWNDLIWELRAALHEETDYRLEAGYLARMKKSLAAHRIHVPKVFTELTSERVLVMEFIEGVFMSDVITIDREDPERVTAWLTANNISREVVGRKLNHSMNRQIFEDNFFHSDLHPGNILLLRDNEIALIDFGAVGSLESEFLRKYSLYYQAIVARQFNRAVDLLLLLAPQSAANVNTHEFRKRYLAVMARFDVKTATNTLGYHERSIVSVFGEIMKDLAAFNIPLDWSFMRADRAQLTLDASLMYLLPGVDYMQLVGEYWRDARTRRVRAAGRMLLRSGGLSGVTEAVGAFVENVEEHRRLGTAALRMQSGLTRRFFGSTMVAIVAGLRMVSALLTVVLIAGAATYVSAGASALLGRLYLESAVSAWRGLPPAIVLLVLVLLVGLRREAISLMSKLYLPQPASLRSRE